MSPGPAEEHGMLPETTHPLGRRPHFRLLYHHFSHDGMTKCISIDLYYAEMKPRDGVQLAVVFQ